MSSTSHLYWILLETDLESGDLYFPADTPLTHVNPKRHYNLLKKRHLRQRERLIKLQVKELDDYQLNFSKEYKDDMFINARGMAATEVVSGSDFLATSSEAIADMLASIPNQMMENTTEIVKDPSSDESKAKEKELLGILKKKYDAGFEAIDRLHHKEWEKLSSIQASELEVIPREFHDPTTTYSHHRASKHHRSSASPQYRPDRKSHKGTGSISPPQKRVLDHDDASGRHYKKSRDTRDDNSGRRSRDNSRDTSGKRSRDNSRDTGESSSRSRDNSRDNRERPPSWNNYRPRQEGVAHSNNKHPSATTHNNNNNGNPPTVAPTNTVGIPTGDRPPAVMSSANKPPTVGIVNNRAPPTVGTSNNRGTVGILNDRAPPAVGTANNRGPPTVGTSNGRGSPSVGTPPSNNSHNNNNNRRDSTPLFGNKPISHKLTSLLDRGTITILKKPNRVIIRGPNGTSTNYGDPKDYDDAINSSVERKDNPVYKRHTQGKDYLFYKTESGKVVTIGPVSKIQPLIHKFFLSM